MELRYIELRHVWGGHPLYDVVAEIDVDPATLPLPGSLCARLAAWAARWDTTFDVTDPGRRTVEAFVVDELGHEGARLWRALLGLLPPSEYLVTYQHEGTCYANASDLPPEWRFG